MNIDEYQKLSELEHKKQSILRQQFRAKIIEHTDISAFTKIKVDNIYFEPVENTVYRMRPIYRDEKDRQEWQDIQTSFEQEEARDILISILEQLTNFDRPAQIISSEESDTENNDADHVDAVEEEIIKTAPNAEYFNRCHNYIFAVQSQSYLLKTGLFLYIDHLQIGYDTSTKEIILPIDETYYHSIRLRFDRAADEREAEKVLKHYNLKPFETAKCSMQRDEKGKLCFCNHNNKEPYRADSPYAKYNKIDDLNTSMTAQN